MKRWLEKRLKRLAMRVLKAYKPMVVGVTGSVGKTSTKRAIKAAIGTARRVRSSEGNYNNELGFPLSILGETNPGRSPFGWLGVLWRGWRLGSGRDHTYPEVLVLEYAADKKGDIQYLTSIARPSIAVVTAVAAAHTEFIGTIDDVAEEKGTLVRALRDDGIAVLNGDDPRTEAMRHMAKGAVVTYGLGDKTDVYTADVRVDLRHDGDIAPGENVATLTMVVRAGNEEGTATVRNVLGDAHVRSMLAGMTVALQLGVPIGTVVKNIADYTPMNGRLKLIGGVKHSLLLDDSYNASPAAVHSALGVLGSFPIPEAAQRIAVIGDMLELGRYSESAHLDVGKHIASLPVDLFVAVGEHARDMARGALDAGCEQERVFTYATSKDAGRFVQQRMKRGDVILIKGSQGVRMERIVKELMAEPLRASRLLVRQSEYWLNKP